MRLSILICVIQRNHYFQSKFKETCPDFIVYTLSCTENHHFASYFLLFKHDSLRNSSSVPAPDRWLSWIQMDHYFVSMCVSLHGCQATAADSVPQCHRGFLFMCVCVSLRGCVCVCVYHSVCFVLDMLLRDPGGRDPDGAHHNEKLIRSPLDVAWLTGWGDK